MADVLVVVDSTAKAESIKGYYGDRAACVLCGGLLFTTSHQVVSGSSSWPHFQFETVDGAGEECVAALHAYRDKEIILALDASTKANYLCWQMYGYLTQIGGRPERIKRLLPAAFTSEELDIALNSVRPVDEGQGVSCYVRQLFDDHLRRQLLRLIGTDRGPVNLPLRQNSLTILFLLAEQERERGMFPQVNKWQVQAELPALGKSFTVCLAKGLDLPSDGLIRDEAKARLIRDKVGTTPFVVEAIRKSALTVPSPPPYQLAELIHDACVQLDLNPASALAMVRRLYHGVEVNGARRGVVSSPFPGAEPPSQGALAALRKEVSMSHGESSLADLASPETGMIIPLYPELSDAERNDCMSREEVGLYDLIRARAVASQMRAATGSTLTIDFRVGTKTIFRAHFHELDEPGFLQRDAETMARYQAPCPVPGIHAGQEFTPLTVSCQQISNVNQTAEPYTIDSLFAALVDFSIIADPETLTLVDTLVKEGYAIMTKQGSILAAGNTAKVVSILDRAFPRMQRINLAAYLEQTISEAVGRRKDLNFALKQFDQTLMLHGKILVKIKIPAKIQHRAKTSSTIIKQPTPSKEGEAALPPVRGEVLPTADAEATMNLEPQAVEEQEAPQASAAEPLPAEPSAPEEAGTPAAREGAEECLDTEECQEEGQPEVPAGEEEQTAWADEDLKAIFAQALSDVGPAAGSVDQVPPRALTDTEAKGAPVTPEQERFCQVCGKAMMLREDQFGAFWGCSGFPECRYSEALTQPEQGPACPLCGQALNSKKTPTGKSFYVCASSECQFMSWSRPHYLPCGLCDSPYLVERVVRGRTQLRCPRAGCPYEQPLSGANQETSQEVSASASKKKVLVRRGTTGTGTGSGATKKVRVVRRRK